MNLLQNSNCAHQSDAFPPALVEILQFSSGFGNLYIFHQAGVIIAEFRLLNTTTPKINQAIIFLKHDQD